MAAVWHSDISFEAAPADFSSFISVPYRGFLESLTATHDGEGFRRIAQSGKFTLFDGERGAPVNVGGDLFCESSV